MNGCMLCPRECGADRENGALGFCGVPAEAVVVRASRHFFEEPPISGTRGSGTVFFAGCSLGCIFCQNRAISHPVSADLSFTAEDSAKKDHPVGHILSVSALSALFLRIAKSGVHNLNLVTPSHFADKVAEALRAVKPQLGIPVVYNCGGYERPETLRLLEGLVDIYLPDFKYISPALSAAYSAAPDYAEVARKALAEMYRQVGEIREENGILQRGLLVRHLVLPGCREDSLAVLAALAEALPPEKIYLSLMRQYTPDFAPADAPKNLRRRLTSFEYDTVARAAAAHGFSGFFQEKDSADAAFTPCFAEAGEFL